MLKEKKLFNLGHQAIKYLITKKMEMQSFVREVYVDDY